MDLMVLVLPMDDETKYLPKRQEACSPQKSTNHFQLHSGKLT